MLVINNKWSYGGSLQELLSSDYQIDCICSIDIKELSECKFNLWYPNGLQEIPLI